MEPVILNLKQEQSNTDWYLHVPSNVPQMPMPTTHKRIPKRSISFTSNGSGHSNPPAIETNSINLDSFKNPLEGLWAHQDWNAEYLQAEQHHSGPQGMETFEFSFGEHQGWLPRDQSFSSEMSEAPLEGAKSEHSSYETLPDLSSISRPDPNMIRMEHFPPEEVTDFKHVIYNLLVEFHNDPTGTHLIEPCTIYENGKPRHGFRFNEACNPEKRLPEMYVQHLKNAQLELENQNSPLIQDLYKFYMRSCVELLSKYFEKIDKYTYLYEDEDNPLFVPNGNLLDAEVRIKNMKTRTRKKKAKKGSSKVAVAPMPQSANLRATSRKKALPTSPAPFIMTQVFKPTPMN